MKVLVTGGAGFIGTNLIKRLLKDGHEVESLDNYSTGRVLNELGGCNYHTGDIAHIGLMDKDFDMIYHLAAIARIQPSFLRPEEYIETNFEGTYEVVKHCVRTNTPLVYAGSSSIHNGRYENPYSFSKDLGEDIIKLYQTHYGLNASIARFYNVYGPYQLTEGGYTTLVGRWMHNIENNIPCEIYGDGTKRRDFTHVFDIVDALVEILYQTKYGYIFELGRGKNYSVNDIAEAFENTPTYIEDKPGEAQDTLNDSIVANEVLGWEPKRDIIDYIKQWRNEHK